MSSIVVFLIAIVLVVLMLMTFEALFSEGDEGSWKRRKL
jgi:hypothetical protein